MTVISFNPIPFTALFLASLALAGAIFYFKRKDFIAKFFFQLGAITGLVSLAFIIVATFPFLAGKSPSTHILFAEVGVLPFLIAIFIVHKLGYFFSEKSYLKKVIASVGVIVLSALLFSIFFLISFI